MAPESLPPTDLEVGELHALLLHPRVVAEVEDAVASRLVEHLDVAGVRSVKVGGHRRCGIGLREAGGVPVGSHGFPFAPVQVGAVGGYGDDGVVGSEVELPGHLDGGHHVADAGQPEVSERAQDSVVDAGRR